MGTYEYARFGVRVSMVLLILWIGLDWTYEVLYCIFNQAREILSCMLRAFVSREYAEI